MRPRLPNLGRAPWLLTVVSLVLVACFRGPAPTPTIPPDATGSILPATTATPAASAAASAAP